ncbi:2Fe-2S iron-sulfur cluster-binding protein [Herbaspirillum chlorophenolicum]|jgi:ferredoxin|uniref:2Fe-2S iron-sulfur cluster-binding protein n=1 Tax=Herbaspirillum chlorophenolicum TaxID=211589 RepID=UPI00067D19AF|nr:2Fe-2S iron-sulfur cluster binding domain-containing protein [Herbaspirillum chlorophenolicum]
MYPIEIVDTGLRYECDERQSLLRGMERLGKRGIPVGCRGGGCGVCKVRVVSGQCQLEKMSSECVSDDDLAEGVVLACKAFPRSEVRVELVDKLQRCVNKSLSKA